MFGWPMHGSASVFLLGCVLRNAYELLGRFVDLVLVNDYVYYFNRCMHEVFRSILLFHSKSQIYACV